MNQLTAVKRLWCIIVSEVQVQERIIIFFFGVLLQCLAGLTQSSSVRYESQRAFSMNCKIFNQLNKLQQMHKSKQIKWRCKVATLIQNLMHREFLVGADRKTTARTTTSLSYAAIREKKLWNWPWENYPLTQLPSNCSWEDSCRFLIVPGSALALEVEPPQNKVESTVNHQQDQSFNAEQQEGVVWPTAKTPWRGFLHILLANS